ncbi:hypothetical protein BgAZ_405070 [Babesia gibsoni]|uniref:Uncharacterized protein n=1 Tax=Babesia gibsoni TaxID=33632 RepID=A0AAD8LJ05_BABGI|nr:hypothetical protein BgAZ_405070 [Babesia gibsoni]
MGKVLIYITGGSCLANTALYGGMMVTYKTDVVTKEAKECNETITPSTTIATGTSLSVSVSESTVTAITCAGAATKTESADIGATACAGISLKKSALSEDKSISSASCARAGIATTSQSGSTTAVNVSSCVGLSKESGKVAIATDSSVTVASISNSGSKKPTRVVVQQERIGSLTIVIPRVRESKTSSAASAGDSGPAPPKGSTGDAASGAQPQASDGTDAGNGQKSTEDTKQDKKEADKNKCCFLSPICWLRKIGKWFFSSGGDGSGGNTNPSSDTT